MAVTVREIGQLTDPQSLIPVLRGVLQDLEDQLNERAQVYTFVDGRTPTNLEQGDLVVTGYKGLLTLALQTQRGFLRLAADMIGGLSKNGCNFLGIIRNTNAAPTITEFPNTGDFGFWFKTNAVVAYAFCINIDGVLVKVTLAP